MYIYTYKYIYIYIHVHIHVLFLKIRVEPVYKWIKRKKKSFEDCTYYRGVLTIGLPYKVFFLPYLNNPHYSGPNQWARGDVSSAAARRKYGKKNVLKTEKTF